MEKPHFRLFAFTVLSFSNLAIASDAGAQPDATAFRAEITFYASTFIISGESRVTTTSRVNNAFFSNTAGHGVSEGLIARTMSDLRISNSAGKTLASLETAAPDSLSTQSKSTLRKLRRELGRRAAELESDSE